MKISRFPRAVRNAAFDHVLMSMDLRSKAGGTGCMMRTSFPE